VGLLTGGSSRSVVVDNERPAVRMCRGRRPARALFYSYLSDVLSYGLRDISTCLAIMGGAWDTMGCQYRL